MDFLQTVKKFEVDCENIHGQLDDRCVPDQISAFNEIYVGEIVIIYNLDYEEWANDQRAACSVRTYT